MSHSEGQTYNILNDSILDAGKLKIGPLQNKIRALNRMRAVKMEDYFHTAGDEKAFISAEKSLRKITSKRWNAELSRGYDVVSNCPFDVEGASVSVSVPVPVLTRTCSSSEMRGQKHENHHRFCPGKRMTVQNNYLGTHTGTGMNIRRAHTSYPTIPVERIVSDLDDEDVQIEDFEEAQSANTADIEKEKEFSSFDILCGGKNERIRNNFSKSTQVTLSNNISKGGIFVSVDPKYLPSESGRSLRSLDLGILSVRTGGITSLP